jgi:signal transduction histidine kinase
MERARGAGIALESDIADDLPRLWADEQKLKQVILNLLTNAVKFTSDGDRVTVRAWYRPDDGYVIQVADTGIGIATADIPTVLTAFGQVDGTLSRKFEGTGLGLPLSKTYVEMHSGSFDLQSSVGAGTTVTLRFPATRAVSQSAAVTISPPAAAGTTGNS